MPQTRSAKKKLRRDDRKTVVNLRQKRALKEVLKKAQTTKSAESIRAAVSAIDKAVKNNLFHKNKAARMKSQLTKGTKSMPVAKKAAAPKAAAKKKPASVAKKPAAKKSSKK